jgi:hypothetical protein
MANPAVGSAFAFIAVGWRRMAIICSSVACIMALGVYPYCDLFVSYPGFWFWWGSMIVALLSACFLLKRPSFAQAEDYGPMTIPESKQ